MRELILEALLAFVLLGVGLGAVAAIDAVMKELRIVRKAHTIDRDSDLGRAYSRQDPGHQEETGCGS